MMSGARCQVDGVMTLPLWWVKQRRVLNSNKKFIEERVHVMLKAIVFDLYLGPLPVKTDGISIEKENPHIGDMKRPVVGLKNNAHRRLGNLEFVHLGCNP
tara:strand:+ start:360 stop:659 length:300 start_codon:yes stop_codon:yes gene_type:complete